MPLDRLEAIIKKIDVSHINKLSFCTAIGDILTDSYFDEKIKLCIAHIKSKDGIVCSTNGGLLNYNENYKRILDLDIEQLQISTPGFDKAAYNRVFYLSNYEEIIEGFVKLLEYKKQNNKSTIIGFGARRDRSSDELLTDSGYIKYIKPYIEEGIANFDSEGYAEMDSWCGQITEKDLTGIMRLKEVSYLEAGELCERLKWDVTILMDGSVCLCGCRYYRSEYDDLVIGNILKADSLSEIINSAKRRKLFIDIYRKRTPQVCKNCTYAKYYS